MPSFLIFLLKYFFLTFQTSFIVFVSPRILAHERAEDIRRNEDNLQQIFCSPCLGGQSRFKSKEGRTYQR